LAQVKKKQGKVPGIFINRRWCKRCGICVELCPKKVFTTDTLGNPVVKRPESCVWCELCELRCPDLALKLEGE